MPRKRRKPELEAKAQDIINTIRPGIFERYAEISQRSLESFVRGYLHWATKKDNLREDGSPYNIASPWAAAQTKLWISAGMPYEFNGGTEETEAEHERAERRKRSSLHKKRRRRRRTAA